MDSLFRAMGRYANLAIFGLNRKSRGTPLWDAVVPFSSYPSQPYRENHSAGTRRDGGLRGGARRRR